MGGRLDEKSESATHGRARKAVRSGNDNLARVSYTYKGSSGKRWVL